MTPRADLHELVEQLPDELTDLARLLLEDLQGAVEDPDVPIDEAALDRALQDANAGRLKLLADYERERGL